MGPHRVWLRQSPIPFMVVLALASVSVTAYALASERAPTNAQRLQRTFNDKPNLLLTALRSRMMRR
jgi:hypothetical protein